jgi:predicted ArsR family transcriptional regulator
VIEFAAMDSFEQRLDSAGALAGGLRRSIYLYVRSQRRPVGREEAARAAGISPKLAAFHLDTMVTKGLLTAHYERLSGKSGPGAGRPSKVYEPSEREISVSIPYRSYDVVGDILLDALESTAGHSEAAVTGAAHDRGQALGVGERRERKLRSVGKKAAFKVADEFLSERGYEPYRDERGDLRLHNCPFHELAQRSPELVCGLNRAFIEGFLSGLGDSSLEAVLDPQPGQCCVRLRGREAVA